VYFACWSLKEIHLFAATFYVVSAATAALSLALLFRLKLNWYIISSYGALRNSYFVIIMRDSFLPTVLFDPSLALLANN